jgi:formate dehydrogenase subunit delta
MDIQNLVTMANRIGDFYESIPDVNEAKYGIIDHIRKFWEPRMREAMVAKLQDPSTQSLHPTVRQAIEENLDLMARRHA